MISTIPITRLPQATLGQIISFLPPEQQLANIQLNKVWRQASLSLSLQFALMRSISNLSARERNFFLENRPSLINYLMNLNFNEALNPSKFKSELLSKVVECKFYRTHFEGISYLRSLPEEQRNMIEDLDFSSVFFVDDRLIEEVITLCPKLKSLTLASSPITGECLLHIAEDNQLEKLSLQNCSNLNEDSLITFFQKAIHLK
ncbi:MAG: hypothetical protein PVI40_05315, partial [Chlamydiota bacterium]